MQAYSSIKEIYKVIVTKLNPFDCGFSNIAQYTIASFQIFFSIIFIQEMKSTLQKEKLSCVMQEGISTRALTLPAGDESTPMANPIFISLKSISQSQLRVHQERITFNNDQKHFTPAFLQLSEKEMVGCQVRKFRQIFQQKIVEAKQHKTTLMLAKPTSEYCMVCKEKFGDYLKHIEHPIHISRLRESHCNKFIGDLARQMKDSKRSCGLWAQLDPAPKKRRKTEGDISELKSRIGGIGKSLFQQFTFKLVKAEKL